MNLYVNIKKITHSGGTGADKIPKKNKKFLKSKKYHNRYLQHAFRSMLILLY